jgi:hypothetical protein
LFAIIAGILIKADSLLESTISILAFIISQIEFILIIFSISLLTGIFNLASYIANIENKINHLTENHMLFWESEISKRQWGSGLLIFTHGSIWIFCGIVFIYLGFLSYSHSKNCWYLLVQIIELIVIIIIMISLLKERSRVDKYIDKLGNDYQNKFKDDNCIE